MSNGHTLTPREAIVQCSHLYTNVYRNCIRKQSTDAYAHTVAGQAAQCRRALFMKDGTPAFEIDYESLHKEANGTNKRSSVPYRRIC